MSLPVRSRLVWALPGCWLRSLPSSHCLVVTSVPRPILGPVRLTPWTPGNLNCFLPAQLPPQKGRHHFARTCSGPSAPSVLFRPSLASALSQSALLLCCLSSRSHPWKGPDTRGEAERAKTSEPFSWLTHSSST